MISFLPVQIMAVMEPIVPFLNDLEVSEITINGEGVVHTYGSGTWRQHPIPEITLAWATGLARLIANHTEQAISEQQPILSATLPTGHRAQIVIAPAVPPGDFSYTIRRLSDKAFTVPELVDYGYFSQVEIMPGEKPLSIFSMIQGDEPGFVPDFAGFFDAAVKAKMNIVVSGSTGSGKTSFMKTLLRLIPTNERLISVQNVEELHLKKTHPNAVSLLYSASGQGVAQIPMMTLMESSLRMMPDRILVAELIRATEGQFFLRNVNSGHPGSITSVHANNTGLALEQLAAFLRETSAGAGLTRDDMLELIRACIDLVVQCKRIDGKYRLTEIRYVR